MEKIGRYQIVGELGKGAMGVVYKATDPNIGRTVAIKTLRFDIHGTETEELLGRFKNEARAAGVMNHANIVTIYDAGEQEGMFYIAMEFIEGQTLQAPAEAGEGAAGGEGHRHRAPGLRRARLRPRARHHPSRHQAGQHHDHRRRHGEDHGFRHRQARRHAA